MGTYAYFYVGRGDDAEWLGGVRLDGYPATRHGNGVPLTVIGRTTEAGYRAGVRAHVVEHGCPADRHRGEVPTLASATWVDCSYAFDEGRVWLRWFSGEWVDPLKEGEE